MLPADRGSLRDGVPLQPKTNSQDSLLLDTEMHSLSPSPSLSPSLHLSLSLYLSEFK